MIWFIRQNLPSINLEKIIDWLGFNELNNYLYGVQDGINHIPKVRFPANSFKVISESLAA